MDDQTHAFWLKYLRQIADLLDLRDWNLFLHRNGPENDELMAASLIRYGRRWQNHWLSETFLHASPETQRQTVIHELLHIHFYPIQAVVHQAFDDDEQRTFCRLHHMHLEETLDSVATAIAEFLPLPVSVPYAKFQENGKSQIATTLHRGVSVPVNFGELKAKVES